jgi:hypothetical protein
MRARTILLLTIPLLLAACADRAPQRDQGPQRYQASSTVLQDKTHGPELCLGIILDSLPPQCRGLPIANWRWDQVDGEQRRVGTTWGAYHVVGTYDGRAFTTIRTGPPEPPASSRPPRRELRSPCPEPAGGWQVPDPSRASPRHLESVSAAAQAEPEFAGLWITYLKPMSGNVAENPGEFVLNVAFTRNLERHRAELRPHWGGRLCVTRLERSLDQLQRIQDELRGAVGRSLGLKVVTSGIDQVGNTVDLRFVVLPGEAKAAIGRRYGAGVVHLSAALTPVG